MKKNKYMKTFFVLMVGLVMLGTPTAYAVGNDSSIVNSGDNATVNSSANQNSSVAVSNENTAVVTQNVNAHANTGGNDANGNIGGTSMTTGNAGVEVLLKTDANNNTTGIAGASQKSANMTDVVNTGNNADINTSTNTNSSIGVSNSNNAVVSQSCGGYLGGLSLLGGMFGGGCDANTGGNDMNDNIGGTHMSTGNAGIAVGADVKANKNNTLIGGGAGNGTVLNGTTITNTGDDASVNASANDNQTVGVANYNTLFVEQVLNAHANTGYNDANDNIGPSAMTTGNAGIETLLGVHANSNATGIGGNLFPVLANLDDVVNTGNDLTANTNVNSNSTVGLTGLNSLLSSQHVWEHSNSGHNDTNDNIGGASMGTHFAGVSVGMTSTGNTNANMFGGLLGSLLSMLMM